MFSRYISNLTRLIFSLWDSTFSGVHFEDAHIRERHAGNRPRAAVEGALEVIESTLGRRQLRFVLAWAELHQEELSENWRRARAGATLQEIEPLG